MREKIEWVKIYNLIDGKEYIKSLQNASLSKKDYGLKITHGLIGTKEWWQFIENGTLPKHKLEGTISKV